MKYFILTAALWDLFPQLPHFTILIWTNHVKRGQARKGLVIDKWAREDQRKHWFSAVSEVQISTGTQLLSSNLFKSSFVEPCKSTAGTKMRTYAHYAVQDAFQAHNSPVPLPVTELWCMLFSSYFEINLASLQSTSVDAHCIFIIAFWKVFLWQNIME
jgi:hypothetical protein